MHPAASTEAANRDGMSPASRAVTVVATVAPASAHPLAGGTFSAIADHTTAVQQATARTTSTMIT